VLCVIFKKDGGVAKERGDVAKKMKTVAKSATLLAKKNCIIISFCFDDQRPSLPNVPAIVATGCVIHYSKGFRLLRGYRAMA
jgi:hypothetical protein